MNTKSYKQKDFSYIVHKKKRSQIYTVFIPGILCGQLGTICCAVSQKPDPIDIQFVNCTFDSFSLLYDTPKNVYLLYRRLHKGFYQTGHLLCIGMMMKNDICKLDLEKVFDMDKQV